jgi:hypothetical protein
MKALWMIAAGLVIGLASCEKKEEMTPASSGDAIRNETGTYLTSNELMGSYKIERYLMNNDNIEEMEGKILKLTKEGYVVLSSDSVVAKGNWKYDNSTGDLFITVNKDVFSNLWSTLITSKRWRVSFYDKLYFEVQSADGGTDRKMTLRRVTPADAKGI